MNSTWFLIITQLVNLFISYHLLETVHSPEIVDLIYYAIIVSIALLGTICILLIIYLHEYILEAHSDGTKFIPFKKDMIHTTAINDVDAAALVIINTMALIRNISYNTILLIAYTAYIWTYIIDWYVTFYGLVILTVLGASPDWSKLKIMHYKD